MFKFIFARGYTIQERSERVKNQLSAEGREKIVAEDIWLNYFNRYLFEHGEITEKEYKRMTEKIAERTAKLSRKKSVV